MLEVKNIRLREGSGTIKFPSIPENCVHAWEPHLWECGKAYCPCCGSLAEWPADSRVKG